VETKKKQMIIKNRDWLVVVSQSIDVAEQSGVVCEGARKQLVIMMGFGFCDLQRSMHIYARAQDTRIKSLRKQEKRRRNGMPMVMRVSGDPAGDRSGPSGA
jgi:hypothetical protein